MAICLSVELIALMVQNNEDIVRTVVLGGITLATTHKIIDSVKDSNT